MSYLANQPILILKEGSSRNRGKDAQRGNISAARIVSEVVKTTLGPRGMDKMMVDSLGDVTITSDGATVLDELDVQHPAAKMLVEVAKTQDDEVGDGTTTSVVLAGELLKRAELLLDQGVHPTVINAGYKKAGEKAKEILNEISKPVDLKDLETLKKVAMTAMHGKSLGGATEHFAKIAVEAVNRVVEKRGDSFVADIDNIQLVKKEGKSLLDTELVNGVIIDKEVVHPGMLKRMEKARIALLDTALEIEKTELSAEIKISNPQQMQSFLDEETKLMKDMVDKIAENHASTGLCYLVYHVLHQLRLLIQERLHLLRIAYLDLCTELGLLDLERGVEERNPSLLHPLRHSRMNDLLVYDYAVDKLGIHEALSFLLHKLNIINISDERVSSLLDDPVDSFNSYLGKMFRRASKTLPVHRGHGHLLERLKVLQIDRLRNLIENLLGLLSGFLVARVDYSRMDSLVEQQLRPLEKFAREHHRSGCPIAHFIVLGLCDLDKHLCSRMLHV